MKEEPASVHSGHEGAGKEMKGFSGDLNAATVLLPLW